MSEIFRYGFDIQSSHGNRKNDGDAIYSIISELEFEGSLSRKIILIQMLMLMLEEKMGGKWVVYISRIKGKVILSYEARNGSIVASQLSPLDEKGWGEQFEVEVANQLLEEAQIEKLSFDFVPDELVQSFMHGFGNKAEITKKMIQTLAENEEIKDFLPA